MAKICPQCGTEAASDTARHCHECGAPLDSSAPLDAPAHQDGPPQQGGDPPPPPPPPEQTRGSPRSSQHRSGLSSETRNWAMAAHLSAFLGAWVALAFVGPLVVWLIKRDQEPFIAEHAREALNFNLTLLIWIAAGFVLAFVLIGIPLLVVVGVAWLILTVRAAVKASNGETYRYPMTIRFVS